MKGTRRELLHLQDEKRQKAEQSQRDTEAEAEASSSASLDPLLATVATKTAVNSRERKRALQKERAAERERALVKKQRAERWLSIRRSAPTGRCAIHFSSMYVHTFREASV